MGLFDFRHMKKGLQKIPQHIWSQEHVAHVVLAQQMNISGQEVHGCRFLALIYTKPLEKGQLWAGSLLPTLLNFLGKLPMATYKPSLRLSIKLKQPASSWDNSPIIAVPLLATSGSESCDRIIKYSIKVQTDWGMVLELRG